MSMQIEALKKAKVQHPPLYECVQTVVQKHITSFGNKPVRDIYELVISEMEEALLDQVLGYTGGNESKAAVVLGISRGTLRQRRRKFGHYDRKDRFRDKE